MDIKKNIRRIAFWLLIVGVVSLIIGLVIAGISFDISKVPTGYPVLR